MSITKRLVLIYMIATGLILGLITGLVYPTLNELALHSSNHLLATICIKKLFFALWGAAGVSVLACYVLSRQSLAPLKQLSSELSSISAMSLGSRLSVSHYPKELKQLASTCNDLFSRIERSFNQMSQFSAGIAHELRNPVHMLRTATEITLSSPLDITTCQSLLEQHLEEFNHLSQLIEKLLLLSRSEHGQLDLSCELHSANALLNSVIDYYALAADEKKVSLSSTGDASIYVDQALFRQVLANLFDNSLRHTKPGGSIKACVSQKNNHVNISITDTGIGIPKEHLPHITEGFYRFGAPQSDSPHLGLGLAISKRILQCHGGTLAISSHQNVGTTIDIMLPSQP